MAYTTLSDVRALDSLTGEEATYTDAMLTEGIDWATVVIDTTTGTAWETKSQTVTLDGNDQTTIWTGVPDLQGVTSCTVDGDSQTVSGWTVTDDGLVRRDTGTFSSSDVGQNVVLVVTYGAETSVPEDIAWCARTLARWYVLELLTQRPSNALSVQNEYGLVQLAQPGRYGPTPLPQVNDILRRRTHMPPVAW